ncbi:FtsX-like permease family protein [Gimesia alba]|uniref:FtsX-like permease family protein n=1 Tax=Gimesia alba TaxID=2527973 RepID=A0A517RCN8_9PLAN|nr:FtsX-like permease family protein [Gimesia alba]QDT41652.1 FtsX-like permease family protein [Gimesia alba]
MRTLDRLLIADLKRMWGQALAICLVLACGVATYTMSLSTIQSIEVTYDRYYSDYRFADVFVSLKRAPNLLAERIREIPGVERIETRVVRDVILDIPGMVEPATCRLVSLPDHGQPKLNAVYLRRGRLPDPDVRGEVLASELFADAHNLKPGDTVQVIMGGRQEKLRIVGIGMSPEYIYAIQPGQFLPDNRHFGVFWMPYQQMAAAFNMEGAFNDLSIKLLPRASEQDVIAEVDRNTEAYGGLGAYGRDDQISHRRVADEIHQLSGMAYISPMIFLAVAAFLFNLVFSRIVHHQQEAIATLRAFGYRPTEIGVHYLKMLLILVTFGFVLGTGAGIYLMQRMVTHYGEFFRFPILYFEVAWDQLPLAAGLSLVVGLFGGAIAIRRAMSLQPAVAMQPEAPAVYHKSWIERLVLSRFLPRIEMMVFQRLKQNLRLTLFSVLGMSLGVALLVLGSFVEDSINYVIDVQFQRAQRQDILVTFNEALSSRAIHDAQHLPGVEYVEAFRAAPVRLSNGRNARRVSLMGLEQRPRLFRVLDQDVQEVTLKAGGLTISKKLAELLDVKRGDEIHIQFLDGRRQRSLVPIVAVFPDYTEPRAYMFREDMYRLLREGESISGVFLSVDPLRLNDFHQRLKETPVAAGVTLKQAALKSFHDTIAENLRPMRITNALFASVIAFGVIYNCALITLAERSRDLATLRILGFTRGEVSRVLLAELAIITLAALPIGLPLGYMLSYFTTLALDTETHRIPLVITRATFAYSAVVILVAATVSALIVRRLIDKLDLIAVLKVKA